MRIQDMFRKDIDRPINGVIKIADKSDAVLEQELSEYVVTHELSGHFASFYRAYEQTLAEPTDEMGVWISGFFGSGKSHFLTMLSHLLENRRVAGRAAVDYFADKFEDPALYEQVRRCAELPAETILFNIDVKNVGGQDADALPRTFARVFYDHLGFYGEDLKLARLEEFIDARGKTAEFRARYEELTGEPWLETRESYEFNSDDVIGALVDTGVMSEGEAERYLEGNDQASFSIDALATKIVEYAEGRRRETDGRFRLVFMVDEVGQFVGNGKDTTRMLNLQSIVEDLGAKGKGSVWVVVTSQEAIDEVVSMSGRSDDFSKITGRFKTRLSLSGIDADEVIKRRILEKNDNAADLLRMEFGQKAAALKNLFHFKGGTAKADLTGYADAEDFVESFPFVSYQFPLLQTTLNEIRRHGSSGKHTSGNERSLLSGFQEAAQAIEGLDEAALVPFWRFYDTIQTFLEGHIRSVVTRADEAARKGQGLEPIDVQVLKLLFLIRWVDDVQSNPENVAILMADCVDANLLDLRRAVTESLDRLVRQNYVSRSGDVYQFLTDDEQEIARAISNTAVGMPEVTARIGQIVFDQIFEGSKLRLDENDFDLERYVDDTRIGAPGGMVLRIVTAASSAEETSHQALALRSGRGEAICLLSDDTRYFELIQDALRIETYANTHNVAGQPENARRIISDRRAEANAELREAKTLLEEAIRKGELYAGGSAVRPRGTTAKQVLTGLLEEAVKGTYPKLSLVDLNYHRDAEIQEILRGEQRSVLEEGSNAGAVAELRRYLENQRNLHLDTSMADVQRHFQDAPYGWREIDVAAVAAVLLAENEARLRYAGSTVDITSAAAVGRLRKATETKRTLIELRVKVADYVRRVARDVVMQVTGEKDLPLDEAELAQACYEALSGRKTMLEELLRTEYRAGASYPGRVEVEVAIKAIGSALGAGRDATDLLPRIADMQDELEDAAEDLEDVLHFFPDQQVIWDKAARMRDAMRRERDYLAGDSEATDALDTIDRVLGMPMPYRQISQLPGAMQTIEGIHRKKLEAKRADLLDRMESTYADIEAKEAASGVSLAIIGQTKLTRREAIHGCASLSELDALATRLGNDQTTFYAHIDEEVQRRRRAARPKPAPGPAGAAPEARPEQIRRVERSLVFKPETLRSEEEVDRYLRSVREALLRDLSGYDGIRIQ